MTKPKALDSKAVHDLVSRAVTALAGSAAAKRVAPSVEAALNLARETAIASSSGKRKPKMVITSVTVSVGGADGGGGEAVTTVFKARQPIDSGPKRRVPIRSGGGMCFTIIFITVCIEWEN